MSRTFPPFGVGPAIWGPYFWTTMHIVSLGVSRQPTAEEQAGIRAFYESLAIVIPCPICREHYKEALTSTPIQTSSRDAVVEWVYDIHNVVNTTLGKPQLSWEGFIKTMRELPKRGVVIHTPAFPHIPTLLVGLLVGAAGMFAVRKFMK